MKKVIFGIVLMFLLLNIFTVYTIRPVLAIEKIYIRPDGTVEPATAPIISADKDTYSLVGVLTDSLIVEKNDTIIDGAGFALQGIGISDSVGIDLSGTNNVTVKNTKVFGFTCSVFLNYSSGSTLSGNNLAGDNTAHATSIFEVSCAIYLNYSFGNTISGNDMPLSGSYMDEDINAATIAIVGMYSRNNSISGNYVTNGYGGIVLLGSNENRIFGNVITNTGAAIGLEGSTNNFVFGNNVTGNFGGIGFRSSEKNNISDNIVADNEGGIGLQYCVGNNIHNNFVTGNAQSGIELQDSQNTTIDGNSIANNQGYGGLYLTYSDNNSILGNNLTGNSQSFDVLYSSYNVVYNNNVESNNVVFFLSRSSHNNIYKNNLTSNNYVFQLYRSTNNDISGNKLKNNHGISFDLYYSSDNRISSNNVSDSQIRVLTYYSSNNFIYLNNFFGAQYENDNVYGSSTNVWNSPQPLTYTYTDTEHINYLGNYWSDYAGTDANKDGIGDIAHILSYYIPSPPQEKDNYPLMQPVQDDFVVPSLTEAEMNEITSKTNDLPEATITSKSAVLQSKVTGDLTGSINLANFEVVLITSGSFTGKGFSKGHYSAIIEGKPYQGEWQGVSFKKPQDNRIYLKGILSGDLEGILEGFLIESTIGSNIYDQFQATCTISHIGSDLVYASLNLNGTLNYQSSTESSSVLHLLQTSIQGQASGGYNGPLNVILTQVRVDSPSNPYCGQGFSIISYDTEFGSGEGWTGDKLTLPGITEINGFFDGPLMSIISGKLDETGLSRILVIQMERIKVGLVPKADLKVVISGPTSVSPGQTVNYIIEVRNDGLKSAENVPVIYDLPWQVSYVSSTGGGEYLVSHQVIWVLDQLLPKTKSVLSARVTLAWGLMGSTFENDVSIPSDLTQPEIDPNVKVDLEILGKVDNTVKAIIHVSNQTYSGDINVTLLAATIPVKPDMILSYDYVKGEEYTTSSSELIIGDPVDVLTVIRYTTEAWNVITRAPQYRENTRTDQAQKNKLHWLHDNDYISDADYLRFKGASETAWWVKGPVADIADHSDSVVGGEGVISGTGRAAEQQVFGRAGLLKAIQLHELERIDNGLPARFDFPQQVIDKYEKETGSGKTSSSSTTCRIFVARDPNVMYGPEGYVLPQQRLNYSIEYENEGQGIAYGVYFTDTLDKNLDESTLQIGPVLSTLDSSIVIADSGVYNPLTRTITWFVGEVGPGQGGIAQFNVTVQSDAADGTAIINYATVYFPSVPETTRTNAIVSVVGEPNIAVTGIVAGSILPDGANQTMTVNLSNKGYYPETFNLTIRANSTTIFTRNETLMGKENESAHFLWDRSKFLAGTYEINASALPVAGETETEDNSYEITVVNDYVQTSCDVTFMQTGLPAGTEWAVTLGSTTLSSTSRSITFNIEPGVYSWTTAATSSSLDAIRCVPNHASGTIDVSSQLTVNLCFKTQYYVKLQVQPSASGTASPTSGWFDAGLTLPIIAAAKSSYMFWCWNSSTPTITFASATLASTTATINGPGTITATIPYIVNNNRKITLTGDSNILILTGGNNQIDASQATSTTIIKIGAGNNKINLGNGNNVVKSTANGNDQITTGNGDNNIYISGNGNLQITTGSGNDVITVTGKGNNQIDAGNGDNQVKVGDGNNKITSGNGNDIGIAGNGNNNIQTGAGNDQITVGNGNNNIDGGPGYDIVTHGTGHNTIKNSEKT